MTTRKLGAWPDGSPEWHAARANRIGGSEIAAVMGWSPWATRNDLLAAKRGEAEDRYTKAMQRGHLLEPAILAWGHDQHDYRYDPAYNATFLHPRFDWALYNPDSVTVDGVLIECKTVADRHTDKLWGRAGTDAIPLYYRAQVAWGMAVLDLEVAHLLYLDGAHNGRPSLSFGRYIIKRDRAFETRLLAAGLRFHRELQQPAAALAA